MPETRTAPETADIPPQPAPPSWRIVLPHAAGAVPMARALVRTALLDLRPATVGDAAALLTAELLATELVTDAVEHSRGEIPVQLVVEQDPAGCRVEVHDGGPAPTDGLGGMSAAAGRRLPAPRPGPYAEEPGEGTAGEGTGGEGTGGEGTGGRGAALIRALGATSGCRPTPHGRAVWFILPG
ncbi:ATP-binding protein [Streptomyces sp. NPDC048650]|uniref:ATP-binding protein n=1 Tax=Streptomyces sp. NPDC048650 TaxID=3365583 RepID=UPI00371495E4